MKRPITQIKTSVESLANRMEQDENRVSGIEDKVEELINQAMTKKKY
jgi:hypothetical protein